MVFPAAFSWLPAGVRHSLRHAVLLCAFLVTVFAAAPARAQADDLAEAQKLFRAGQMQPALERVNRVLQARPRDAQARFLRGLILTEQGNTKEAVAVFQRLTEDFPELPEPWNNLAVIFASQGLYDRARQMLEQSIRTHPSYATAYENLGDVYARLASQAYDRALQLDSGNTNAKQKLALVRELVGGSPPRPAATTAAKGGKPAPAVVAEAPKIVAETPKAAAGTPRPAAEAPKAVAEAPRPAAEPKPAPAEAKPAAKPPAGSPDDVLKTVRAWAEAWSRKDVDAYLAFYARDFQTPGGESREEWEKGRRVRLSAPKSIAVTVEQPAVTLSGENRALVNFRQNYRSDVIKASSRKQLVMVRTNGRWLIQQEKVGP